MVTAEYSRAYSEVLEILKHLSIEDYKKIPDDRISFFRKNSSENFKVSYDPNLTLEEQNISPRAIAIIALLFRDYWSTPNQKQKILAKQKYDLQKIEEERQKKYSSDNLFTKTDASNFEPLTTTETSMVFPQEQKWYQKFFNYVKNIFIKNYNKKRGF